MIIDSKSFKDCCQNILYAIDNKNVSLFTETLELESNGGELNMNVTNREYYVNVHFNTETPEKLAASVNAKTFLSLISKITTEKIELKVDGNSLKVKANGEYSLPMIYNNNARLELPKISLGEVTNEMEFNSSTLLSILNNNSKELLRGVITRPVQNYYYMDKEGAITFSNSGACVNSFELSSDINLLLSDKVVKLFKLFKNDNKVYFKLGQNQLSEDMIQSVMEFKSDKVCLTAKMSDSSLITGVPVKAVRDMASKTYDYSMVLSKEALLQALNRVMIFFDDSKTYGNIIINNSTLTLQDANATSSEVITATSNTTPNEYKMNLDFKNLKLILDGCEDEFITMCFGDGRSVVIRKQGISDIIRELKI